MNLKRYINPRNAFLLSMMLLGVGLATSNILMSWGQIGLGIAFIWDGKFKSKMSQLFTDGRMLAIMGVYFLFVLGLFHTNNFPYALHDLKVKLPMLLIPFLAFSFFPFTKNEFKIIFHSIYSGVLFTMIFGLMIYLGWIRWEINDMRNYSPFVSNVRLGTLLVFCFISIGYFVFDKAHLFFHSSIYILFGLACLAFLLLIQSLTGFVALIGCLSVLVVYGLFKKQNRKASILLLVVFLLIAGILTLLTIKEYKRIHILETINIDQLPKSTVHGAVYRHDLKSTETVNGHYVRINVCNWELKREWNKRSQLDFEGPTKKGWAVNETLIKYLTSKGVKKNAEAVQALTDREVKAIENGVVNFLNLNPLDIRWRINQLLVELDEYKKDGDPNGRSFATRLETWKVARLAINESFIIGYGTGDVRDKMKETYQSSHSKLVVKNYLNPHQQYLTIMLSIGLIGLILFVGLIFYPIIKLKKIDVLFLAAIVISGIAMLDEDTLETQAGCTQFVFVYVITYINQKSKRLQS